MLGLKKRPNTPIMNPVKLSAELKDIIGKSSMPRTEVVKKLWSYIKKQKLQNPKDKREIIPDDKLAKVLGKDKINIFDMAKKLQKHFS